MQDVVSVKQFARLIGLDRSAALRYLKRIGVRPRKRRTPDSGNQLAATITTDEAETVLRLREEGGFVGNGGTDAPPSESGYFYVIQVVPELSPGRVKLGFAAIVDERLRQHRTAAPTAVVLKAWPCRRTWEYAAMDAVTRSGSTLIQSEVFEVDGLAAFLLRGDAFFAAMPDPGERVPLSPYSPLASGDKPENDDEDSEAA